MIALGISKATRESESEVGWADAQLTSASNPGFGAEPKHGKVMGKPLLAPRNGPAQHYLMMGSASNPGFGAEVGLGYAQPYFRV